MTSDAKALVTHLSKIYEAVAQDMDTGHWTGSRNVRTAGNMLNGC